MKKGTKIMLVTAGVFAAVGIGFMTAGTVMGARTDAEEIEGALRERFGNSALVDEIVKTVKTVETDWDDDDDDRDDDRNEREPASAGTEIEGRVYEISELPELDVELNGESVLLREHEGAGLRVEVEGDANESVRVTEDENALKVKSVRKAKENRTIVVISYPAGYEFREAELELGAGKLGIENDFRAEHLDITVGAGDIINSGKIETKEAEFEVGAGTMKLQGLSVTELEGECGIGEMRLGILGREEDYSYSLECGVGRMQIGATEYSGFAGEKKIDNPGAAGSISLECGIGELAVEFTEG